MLTLNIFQNFPSISIVDFEQVNAKFEHIQHNSQLSVSFYATGIFLYRLKTSESLILWCFQGVYKDNNGMEWVNPGSHLTVFEQTELFESPLNMQSAIKRLLRFMTY